MIVDMVRNDMGRIAVVGSVDVTRLYDVERYPTVWQMTSTVQARTHASLPELMRALFPCASITGAPKPRTMQIIAELETTPRGVYTGAIGFMAPGPRAQFNVAIRTVVLDRATGQAEYGVGGGILWDSESAAEYEECRIKAQVLTRRSPDFALLETLLWTPEDGYFLLSRHLSRLRDSAEYFGIPLDLDRVRKLLDREASRFAGRPHRMRLLVAGDGLPVCECMPWPAPGDAAHDRNGPVRLRFAREPIDAADPFMFHKTTSRAVYEAARAGVTDADDVLLWNVRGEVTETSIANIVVAVDNTLVTPPVSCGLLAGTFRAWLLERHEVEERVIMRSDLTPETRMYVVNSVRGRREARLVLD